MAQIIPQQVLLSLSEFLDKLYASDDFPPKLLNAEIRMRLYTCVNQLSLLRKDIRFFS